MTYLPRPARTAGRLSLALAALTVLAACSADIAPRGNEPAPELLAQVKPGELTRGDVRALLGSPSTTSAFGDETWYYISSQTTQWAFNATEELQRQVVAISFDERGIVKDVRTMDESAGRDVEIVDRTTPTPGREETIIQQLLGNLGRFNKDAAK
ncbi:MAG: outer membrane protein assembly factor BamE [Caenispirillum bisanense]|nr:outer membrane protein assembly factor BamE [Caenispirillum bisanense]MCA1972767.1 outer membrane protein assembly factor BamE [Caenispirillum sp.]